MNGYSGTNAYDPNSERAERGEAFQIMQQVSLAQLLPRSNVMCVRDWLRDVVLVEEHELNAEEKKHGDITFVFKGRRWFVECKLLMGPWTHIDELTRQKFFGRNKFYCLGVADPNTHELLRMCYVPSLMFQKYLGECPLGNRDGWLHRVLGAHLVGKNLRYAVHTNEDFVKVFLR
jgi:hypothetical protein